MKVEKYDKDEKCIILNDCVVLGVNEQTDIISWVVKNCPELISLAMAGNKEKLDKITKEATEGQHRFYLDWMCVNKPDLLRDAAEKTKKIDDITKTLVKSDKTETGAGGLSW